MKSIKEKYNDDGCFKLIYEQDKGKAKEFSNVAYIYIEENNTVMINIFVILMFILFPRSFNTIIINGFI